MHILNANPGKNFLAHPSPYETIPALMQIVLFKELSEMNNPPPESPWHVSAEPFKVPNFFQNFYKFYKK